MAAAAGLHRVIDRYNFLKKPTEILNEFFYNHPNVYKVVLIANHIFRAAAMIALMILLPFGPLINTIICLGGSLFYRLTVENNCAYKFALPAFFGAAAFLTAKSAWIHAIAGTAIAAAGAWALAALSLIPIAGYLIYIILTVSYDVDHK